jgi:hypothetical protein
MGDFDLERWHARHQAEVDRLDRLRPEWDALLAKLVTEWIQTGQQPRWPAGTALGPPVGWRNTSRT